MIYELPILILVLSLLLVNYSRGSPGQFEYSVVAETINSVGETEAVSYSSPG